MPADQQTSSTASAREALAGAPRTPGGAKEDAILVADNVVRTFGGITAVDVEHLEVQRHTITALIGPNGAGKTTFFNLLTGFDRPDSGTWKFDGTDISRLASHKVARKGMVRTFQLTKSLARLTVLENMLLGAAQQRGEHLWNAILPFVCDSRSRRTPLAPTNCSSTSTWSGCATTTPVASPVGNANSSRWPGPSWSDPRW